MDQLAMIVAASAGSISLVGVLARLHYGYWVRRLGVELEYREQHSLRAADGLPYALLRLPEPEAPVRDAPPVLLVHGIAANHRNIDPEDDLSLARHLRRQGRDVWLLNLRSGHADLKWRERRRADFRSMVEHDLPEAVDFVLANTEAPALDYVGFSMGGILLYAALGRSLDPARLRRAATIGSPARVAPPLAALARLPKIPRALLRVSYLRLLARMGAFAAEGLTTPLHRQIYNPDNVARGVASRALVNMISDIPPPLFADFAGWALADGIVRVGEEDVLARLPDLDIPVRFFAGAADQIARPSAVRAAFESWGAAREGVDKHFVLLGREHGHAHDYGHGDLALGERLGPELFEPLAAFLAQ